MPRAVLYVSPIRQSYASVLCVSPMPRTYASHLSSILQSTLCLRPMPQSYLPSLNSMQCATVIGSRCGGEDSRPMLCVHFSYIAHGKHRSLLRDSDSPTTLCLQHAPPRPAFYYHFQTLAATGFRPLSWSLLQKLCLSPSFSSFLVLLNPLHLLYFQ